MRKQFNEKLSIDPYPGTLNLEIVDQESLQIFKQLKSMRGEEIIPEDPSFCNARCYPVLVNGQLKAAIIFPLVEGYPENKMELIASENIKNTLSVETGDCIEVEILCF